MKRFFCSALLFLSVYAGFGQGMWLPSLLEGATIEDMQRRGLKLSAEDLYSVNQASLNDAIVRFGRGCTGEMISPEGLLLTNHHCGYGQIQQHSSLENDYLTYGFVAQSREQELPNPGLTVSFLREMRDVTDLIKAGKTKEEIIKKATRKTNLQGSVEAMYYGAEHYLFLYEVYEDVRLVFAPPSAIGKFGGDTDNWMWPRHTGDFSMFRVYADKNGKPAKYSKDNVPYEPVKFFELASDGVKEGDFTFVYGFPGSTQQYLHSKAVDYIVNTGNPHKIKMRDIRLEHFNNAADSSADLRIKYASKNASVSNAWKKWQGEKLGLERLKTIQKKTTAESEYIAWAKGTEYEGVVEKLDSLYTELLPILFKRDIFNEGVLGSEMMRYLSTPAARRDSTAFYKDYSPLVDSIVTAQLFEYVLENLPAEFIPEGFSADSKPSEELVKAFTPLLDSKKFTELNQQINELYQTYIAGMRKKDPERRFFPDANLTLRITYGKVAGYTPYDGAYYVPNTTIRGIIEKDNPEIYDYNVPQRLRDLAVDNMDIPVAFIATNHTSGGNSGSPVLNAEGQLVGLNFDRVWQGTMSDVDFDPEMCRNISMDVRYILFLVGEYAGAKHLLDEMVIR